MPYLPVDERRRRILDAAVEVIASEGLARTTTRRIAEKAQAPLGALHYCFRDKDELIQLVAEQTSAKLDEAFGGIDPARGLEQTIRDCIQALWAWYQENIDLQLALIELAMWRVRRGGEPKEVYAMWDTFGGNQMREYLRAATKADGRRPTAVLDDVVRFILHRFDGLVLEYAASRDDAACGRQMQLLAEAMVAVAAGDVVARNGKRAAAARR